MSAIMETEADTNGESAGELSTVFPSVPLGTDAGDDIASLGSRLRDEMNNG